MSMFLLHVEVSEEPDHITVNCSMSTSRLSFVLP